MAQKGDNRTQFKLYKEDVQRRGKPFFPYAMFHDTVMSLVVVTVIVVLAVIWKSIPLFFEPSSDRSGAPRLEPPLPRYV